MLEVMVVDFILSVRLQIFRDLSARNKQSTLISSEHFLRLEEDSLIAGYQDRYFCDKYNRINFIKCKGET